MTKARKKHKILRRLIIPILVLSALLVSVYDSNTRIETEFFELYYDNLPVSFDGFRIAHLSDMHANIFGKDSERLYSAIKKSKPHIIVITGDLIGHDGEVDIVVPQLKRLLEIAPVYYATGNHEWSTKEIYLLFDIMSDIGVTALRNSYTRLTVGTEHIILAGVDDENGPADMKKPHELMEEIISSEGDVYTLLLSHRPYRFPEYAKLGFDTVLSGHNHGGLIRLPFVGGLLSPGGNLFPRYTEGVYSEGGSDMLISRGLSGVNGFPRIFNPLHIPILILRKK